MIKDLLLLQNFEILIRLIAVVLKISKNLQGWVDY